MYPPISANSRVSQEDDIIETGGLRYFLPAGTHVGWGVYQLHRREDLWGKDASEWRPDRWLDESVRPGASSAAFQAWGSGPRVVRGSSCAWIILR